MIADLFYCFDKKVVQNILMLFLRRTDQRYVYHSLINKIK